MKQLYYASRAREPFTAEALDALLEKARVTNEGLQLTGLLIYGKGAFLQVVEGPDDAVDEIFRRISGDPRHELLMRSTRIIRERSFPEWRMGYLRLGDDAAEALPGYSAFFDPTFDLASLPPLDPMFRRLLDGIRASTVPAAPAPRRATMLGAVEHS